MLFLVPLLSVLAVPSVLKTVPDHQLSGSRLDVFGIVLIAALATNVMLFLQNFNWWFMVPVVISIALLWSHISSHTNVLVDRAFFADRRYVSMLLVVTSGPATPPSPRLRFDPRMPGRTGKSGPSSRR